MKISVQINITKNQARSQKFAMGGAVLGSGGGSPSRRRPMRVWRRSPEPLDAGGLEAKWRHGGRASPRASALPPKARGSEARGQGGLKAEARGSEGGAPSARKFCNFLQK